MEFPTMVYRCPGEHHAHSGATYKYRPVTGKDELDDLLKSGWSLTLVEAVDAWKNPKVEKQIQEENSPPTREELESKAKELGIKFDGRTGDAKLLKLINERV